MARYHLYYLNDGMLVGSGDIEAIDDNDAARIARAESRGQVFEVWNDHSRIRVVSTAKVPVGRDGEDLPAIATPAPRTRRAT